MPLCERHTSNTHGATGTEQNQHHANLISLANNCRFDAIDSNLRTTDIFEMRHLFFSRDST